MFETSVGSYAVLWGFGALCLIFIIVAGLVNLWRSRDK